MRGRNATTDLCRYAGTMLAATHTDQIQTLDRLTPDAAHHATRHSLVRRQAIGDRLPPLALATADKKDCSNARSTAAVPMA